MFLVRKYIFVVVSFFFVFTLTTQRIVFHIFIPGKFHTYALNLILSCRLAFMRLAGSIVVCHHRFAGTELCDHRKYKGHQVKAKGIMCNNGSTIINTTMNLIYISKLSHTGRLDSLHANLTKLLIPEVSYSFYIVSNIVPLSSFSFIKKKRCCNFKKPISAIL